MSGVVTAPQKAETKPSPNSEAAKTTSTTSTTGGSTDELPPQSSIAADNSSKDAAAAADAKRWNPRLRSLASMGGATTEVAVAANASSRASTTVSNTNRARADTHRRHISGHGSDFRDSFSLSRLSYDVDSALLVEEEVENNDTSKPSRSHKWPSWTSLSHRARRITRTKPFCQRRYRVLIALLFVLIACFSYEYMTPQEPDFPIHKGPRPPPIRSVINFPKGKAKPPGQGYTRTLVVGHTKRENITWLYDELPKLDKRIYSVDDLSSDLHTPINKGHEAFVYLHYIIYNYDSLPDTVLFFHAEKEAWHNNMLLNHNSVETIKRLSDARVAREGYVNTRCETKPGCPDWLHIDRPRAELDYKWKPEERYFTSKLWKEVFPDEPVPFALSQPCCAQFAVSRDFIRARPQEQYVFFRDWLLQTKLNDRYAGRIFEYSWQFIFRGVPELCPSAWVCSCDLYGVCFESEADLEDWHVKRKQADDAMPWVDTSALTRELEERRAAAVQRGNNPQIRAKVAGRPWKPGDGF